jgi:POT family proton-dependent oligopeptide transporter
MLRGHPKGLYPLFFTEMWERLGFYLMVGILVLYARDFERGGLGLSRSVAAEIMGTYLAFVYFTPFLGGMIADRFLGFRRSVFIGGLTMAAGYFALSVRSFPTFYTGLTLLCLGNGLFKPNISAMVGNLYKPGDPKRDIGFNIFYMGINIGATFAALFSSPIRNKWDFNAAFFVAGVGLLIGTGILVLKWKVLANADKPSERDPDDVGFGQIMKTIIFPALLVGVLGYFVANGVPFLGYDGITYLKDFGPSTFGFIVGMLPVVVYFIILLRKAKPEEKPGLGALMPVYVAGGAFFMILHLSAGLLTFFTEENTKRPGGWIPDVPIIEDYKQKAMPSYYVNADPEVPRPDERILVTIDDTTVSMFGQKRISEKAIAQITRQNEFIKVIDKEDEAYQEDWDLVACKVYPEEDITIKEETDSHGETTISVQVPETAKALKEIAFTREIDASPYALILVTQDTFDGVYQKASDARLAPGEYLDLFNTELVTGFLNPIFVVLCTPIVIAFFSMMIRRRREISTARKIFIGMVLTTISLAIMAWGSYLGGDGESKVSVMWLVTYYLIITFGELCLSPMGLSLVTKLSPKRLVGLMMGTWFLSTSVGNKLSGFISGLEASALMFLLLAGLIFLVAMFIFVLLPRLDAAIKKYGA